MMLRSAPLVWLQYLGPLWLVLALSTANASGASNTAATDIVSSTSKMDTTDTQRTARQTQLIDAEELDCPTNVATTKLQRQVLVPLEGNSIQDIEPSFLQAIEAAFLSSYNSLRFVACDSPHFRRVTAVNVTGASTTATSTTSSASQAAMVITLAVEAICYNCTEYMPLFDLPTTDPNGTSKTMRDNNPNPSRRQLRDKMLPGTSAKS
jgi:hypothetical protein